MPLRPYDRTGNDVSAAAGFDVVLRDGSTVHLRRVEPADVVALEAFLAGLTVESRWRRFFTAASDLHQAARLAAEVAARDGYGLVATVGTPPRIVGHGSFERLDRARAEVAYEVADALQGRGLGTILTAHLAAAARAAGLRTLTAEVLAENTPMLEVFGDSGFQTSLRRSPDGLHVELATAFDPDTIDRYLARERASAAAAVGHFLHPAAVAVIAAGPGADVGQTVLRSLLRSGFDGPIWPVTDRANGTLGLAAWPAIDALPDVPELAVAACSADATLEVARDCAVAGVRGLLVVSPGFAESGLHGGALQDELLAICRAAGMRLIGPHSVGTMSAAPPFDATLRARSTPSGRLGLLDQSGRHRTAPSLERAAQLGMGLSSFVSLGNRADISTNDALEYWEDDPATDAILIHAESFGNPRNFVEIARRVAARKPIVALSADLFPTAPRARGSLAAAIAASAPARTDALLAQAGVIPATSMDELFEVAAMLTSQRARAAPAEPGRTARARKLVAANTARRHSARGRPATFPDARPELAAQLLGAATTTAAATGDGRWLDDGETATLLAAWAVPTVALPTARRRTGTVELFAGVTRDPRLGPLVVCGACGPPGRPSRDMAVRLAPLTATEAAEMVDSLALRPLLDGGAGAPPADVAALDDLVARLGALAAAHPEVAEVHCEPVLVGPLGASVAHARVRVAAPPPRRPWPSLGTDLPLT